MKQPLIILTGPTAVGKTSLSIRLAKAVDGEIISADSMQIYKHMDIGSAKVTKKEMDGVPHHLIDLLEPWEECNVVTFQQLAKTALEEIASRGRVPIVAGGTGFYIQALLYDIDFKDNEEGGAIRRELEAEAEEKGGAYLHGLLEEVDPESARAIHPNNLKRVIRALEYYRQTGETISAHNEEERKKESPYEKGDHVTGRIYEISNNFGAFVAVDDCYSGLIPKREAAEHYQVGEVLSLRVTAVKADGKLDLSSRERIPEQMNRDAEEVLRRLEEKGGVFDFTDKADPELIKEELGLTKNAFKRAVGRLLKQEKIEISNGKIVKK